MAESIPDGAGLSAGHGRYTAGSVVPLSAVIITLDEEQNLPGALESVRFCDDVLVVDWGSTDRTREIAEEAGARVVHGGTWPGFVAGRNAALDAARHDWVLALDADERITPALRDEIQAERAARLPARGLPHAARGLLPRPLDPRHRLVPRPAAPPVRPHAAAAGRARSSTSRCAWRARVGRLRSDMQHLSYADVSHHMRVIDTYTTLWARQAFEQGRRAFPLEPFAACLWAFFRNLVLRRRLPPGRDRADRLHAQRLLHLREAGEAAGAGPARTAPR